MVWARSRLKNTTASAVSAPFLVAPKESTSTPAFQVASAGVQPSRATALARRAPSMCTHRRRARVASTMPRTSLRAYTVLVSVQVSGLGHVDGPVGRGDDRRAEPVGGRSRAHGIDLDLGLEQLREAGLEPLGDGVGAVRRGVASVRGDERLQDHGGGAG